MCSYKKDYFNYVKKEFNFVGINNQLTVIWPESTYIEYRGNKFNLPATT